ncbi:hypothetical protein JTE90_029386 [Oedothorax gibbosus]|uniref:Uncharacterized protein n=1 Tax=Oedothorax gibbosus TaxID=931172 RepID=A0AAV6VMT3_9ARAC|nr:hypothetical protein JTE90_029386 [Oedothorax gibbosus]
MNITRNFNTTKFERSKKPPKNNINVLQSLMKEVNLNCKLQDEILNFAESGQSLPYIPKNLIKTENVEKAHLKKVLKLPPRPMQRMKSKIESTGSYEREPYRPDYSKTRPSKEKERLQNMMAFGKDLDEDLLKQKLQSKDVAPEIDSSNLITEILTEIKEREDFLEEMSQLGLREKYLPEIECQISLRLKELEKLNKMKRTEGKQDK